jgi:hypothetical protein
MKFDIRLFFYSLSNKARKMPLYKIRPIIWVFFLFLCIKGASQPLSGFPQSKPETEGVSSKGIYTFLEAAEKSKNELHGFMFLRHGKIIAKAWWNPYAPGLKHSMYSVSKSFTSTAIGLAVAEKRLTVNDKVISFFPRELPDTISSNLAELTVKNLLTMSVGQDPEMTFTIVKNDSDWVKAFLRTPIVHKPGSKFLYNSLASYMLSAIIQKITGLKLMDYLNQRLFNPLGIRGIDWETDQKGINTGGWGLRLKTEDMAKFGELYLNKGKWNGRQIVAGSWIEEATTMKIDQQPDSSQTAKEKSDWLQGYCYQFWRCRHNAFRADGAYGQYIIVLPDQDAVIVICSETANMQDELNMVWKFLLPSIHPGRLEPNPQMDSLLRHKMASLALGLPVNLHHPDKTELENAGRTFLISPNEKGIQAISFRFSDNRCFVRIKTAIMSYDLVFGSGRWEMGETRMPGPNLFGQARGHFSGLPSAKVAGSFAWKGRDSLEFQLRYIESPHTERIICSFESSGIRMEFHNSFEGESKKLVIKGSTSG